MIDRDKNIWYIVDFAVPMDHHVKEKEETEDMIWSLQTAISISFSYSYTILEF